MEDETTKHLITILLGVLLVAGCTDEQKIKSGYALKQKQNVTMEEKKGWALGCAGVLTERNHGRHDSLNPSEINERNIKKEKELLNEWWGINSRNDLFDKLLRLHGEGHREKFDEMGKHVTTLSEEEYGHFLQRNMYDQEIAQEIRIAKEYYQKLGSKSILGWDYSRYICLCRWGYLIGYLSEEEAWQFIMEAARILQKTFDSWEDLGRNYLIGRQFWSYKETIEAGHEYDDAFQRLVDMPSSPWNKSPGYLDLGSDIKKINDPNKANMAKK